MAKRVRAPKTITVTAVEKGPRPRKRTRREVEPIAAIPGENELLIIPGRLPEKEAEIAEVPPALDENGEVLTYEEFEPPLERVAGGKIHEWEFRHIKFPA